MNFSHIYEENSWLLQQQLVLLTLKLKFAYGNINIMDFLANSNTQYYSGEFKLSQTRFLAKFFYSEKQEFIRPDFFDTNGNWYRLLDIDSTTTLIKITNLGIVIWISSCPLEISTIQARVNQLVIPIEISDDAMTHLPPSLAQAFKNLNPLVHVSSASIEEALIKAIIRQVITAGHAKKLLHRFITQFGESYYFHNFLCYRFPTLEKILGLPLDDLINCGLGFKASLIKQVASELAEKGLKDELSKTSASEAIEILQRIKGIGRWTAHVTLCDFTGDWSLYPFEDLAVRTWAYKLWSSYNWSKNPTDFKHEWETINGPYVSQVTFYLLALAALPHLFRKEKTT